MRERESVQKQHRFTRSDAVCGRRHPDPPCPLPFRRSTSASGQQAASRFTVNRHEETSARSSRPLLVRGPRVRCASVAGSDEDRRAVAEYWNHNTAYHSELLEAVPHRASRILDVGCGDGLLLQKFATKAASVTGIDPDPSAVARARARVSDTPHAHIIAGDVLTAPELDGRHFDLITCVATLHHMPLVTALERLRELLTPGGRLRIVGLSANKTVSDWIVSGALVLPIRMMSRIRREAGYPEMVTEQPCESLAEIRDVAGSMLPGNRIRRRFYYRYTLNWSKPLSTPMR
ncbi:class I SAM-dependent methyltransferase [Rhodococcus pyridinivorans]|nr:class I SAM-dependent methyltransferase [Rhodococcus pyridinivorans]UPK66044.1 class I SAM-dependent methyltransferase [Rhodococcus pyridinivorans]